MGAKGGEGLFPTFSQSGVNSSWRIIPRFRALALPLQESIRRPSLTDAINANIEIFDDFILQAVNSSVDGKARSKDQSTLKLRAACGKRGVQAPVAQWIEHRSSKPMVAGSIPAGCDI